MTTFTTSRRAARAIGKLVVFGFTTIWTLGAMLAPGSSAGAATRDRIAIGASYTAGPDTVTRMRCMPTSAPSSCRGTAAGDATYVGGWAGTSHYIYRFVIAPTGQWAVEISEQFLGTIAGCGAGAFTVVTHETIDPSGEARGSWAITGPLTGDFRRLTGNGTSTASYALDGTGTGQITGRVGCPTADGP